MAKQHDSDFAMPTAQTSFGRRVRSEMSDPKRLAAFAELKQRLADVWVSDFDDDLHLYRFFKARDFDASKTEQMVRNHLQWRQDFRADELLSFQEPDVLTKFYPGGFCGVDKEGYPVWYEASGLIDPQGIARSVPKEQLLRSRTKICEQFMREVLPRRRRETGLPLYSCTFVIDLHNYGRRHLWGPGLEFYAEFVRICEQNYPETIGTAYIINAPAVFPIVYNLIKPLLHQETQKKIKVLGKNYKQVLLEVIDADQLPKIYGGSRTDPDGDPRCSSLICWGGDVPKELYLKPNYPDRLLQQTIGRRAKFRVEISVSPSGQGQCIEWDFLTDDGDLGFEILSSETQDPLVTYRKVHCGICPCSGAVSCPRPGNFTVCFDNSFSWMSTKRLRYFVHVTNEPRASLLDDADCRRAVDSARDSESFERDLDALMVEGAAGAAD